MVDRKCKIAGPKAKQFFAHLPSTWVKIINIYLITKGYDKDDHFLQGEFEIQFEYAKTTKTVEVRVGLIFLTFVHRATSYSIQIHI